MCPLQCRPQLVQDESAHEDRVGHSPRREMPERRLDKENFVVRENVLHQQTKIVRKFRPLKS
jgi:hypothetical protein